MKHEDINLTEDNIVDIFNEFLPSDKQLSQDKGDALIKLSLMFAEQIQEGRKSKKKDLSDTKQWLNLSEGDLKSSKLLLENKDYRNAMMLLQQSVEKLVKAYSIAYMLVPRQQIKKISHKSPLAFSEGVKQEWIVLFVDVLKQQYPQLNADTTAFEDTINKKGADLALLSAEEMAPLITLCNTLDAKLKQDENKVRDLIKSIVDSFAELLTEKQLAKCRKLENNFDAGMISSVVNLYLLSTITYSHINYTRYPDEKVKPSVYDADLGIVKTAPEIYTIMERAITNLRRYLEVMNA